MTATKTTLVFHRPLRCSTIISKKQASSRVIGRQGTFIKQLQRESGCKINTLNDTELRSGLKARVMNVCGTNSSMSKGLYLIARKIASRWEYAPEWEGGDPTLPSGQGLPSAPTAAHSLPPPDSSSMDVDSGRDSGGRRQRGQRGRGGRDRGDDLDRYDRDGGRNGRSGESDRRGGGGSGSDRGSSARDSGGGRYGRGGRDSHDSGGRDGSSKSSRGAAPPLQTTSAPWIMDQPSAAAPPAHVPAPAPVGSSAAAVAAAASAEAWQRLLGQIPATARESLGFGAMPVPATAAAAADMFGQLSGRAAVASVAPQQQLHQAPQVCVCVCVCDSSCSAPTVLIPAEQIYM